MTLASESQPCNAPRAPRIWRGLPGRGARRGTAMMEMILIIPFVAVILSMMIYLGYSIVRLQTSRVVDRYEAWRQVAIAPAPGADGMPVPSSQRENVNDGPAGNDQQLNELFFRGRATSVESSSERYFPGNSLNAMVESAYAQGDTVGRLAMQQLTSIVEQDNQSNGMFIGRKVGFEVKFPQGDTLWSRWEKPYRHSHVRIGNEWRAANGWKLYNDDFAEQGGAMITIEPAIRDIFYTSFDGRMQEISGPGKRLADSLRTFYNRRYIYCGPDIRYRCWWW